MANTPVAAAPLLIGTNPASVSRFSMLHACHCPSETQPDVGGFGTVADSVDAESARGVAVDEPGLDAIAESARGVVSPPHAIAAVISASVTLTRTPIRIPPWHRARTAGSARRRTSRHPARSGSRLPCARSAI